MRRARRVNALMSERLTSNEGQKTEASGVVWYLAGAPLIACLHCFLWLRLIGKWFEAGESHSVSPEWSHWYSPRILAFAVLSFPGVVPGCLFFVIPLRLLLRSETASLIGLAVINGLIWGNVSVYLVRLIVASQ